jgi:hypothetical protein
MVDESDNVEIIEFFLKTKHKVISEIKNTIKKLEKVSLKIKKADLQLYTIQIIFEDYFDDCFAKLYFDTKEDVDNNDLINIDRDLIANLKRERKYYEV